MKHLVFKEGAVAPFKIAILIKETAISKAQLQYYYIKPLEKLGYMKEDIVALGLKYVNGKAMAKASKEFLANNILPICSKLEVHTLICVDATYFKYLTKKTFASTIAKYAKTDMPHYEGTFKVIPMVSYKVFIYNPLEEEKIGLCLSALESAITGLPSQLGKDILKNVEYPVSLAQIVLCLDSLLEEKEVAVDIEAFSLDYIDAGIGTISFSKDKVSAITFSVDYVTQGEHPDHVTVRARLIREQLVEFFDKFKGKIIYHRGQYDITVLVYNLFMEHEEDRVNMIRGLKMLTKNVEDTLILTYVCTNSASGNTLGLKDNSLEYTGNYAIDIKDITKHPVATVLEYNAIDTIATQYLKEKYWDQMLVENQYEVYRVQVDAIPVLSQVQIEGMPMDVEESLNLHKRLDKDLTKANDNIQDSLLVSWYTTVQQKALMYKTNLALKIKVKPISDFFCETFNPKSTKQKGDFLHNFLGLPVVDVTPTGQPQTGKEQLNEVKSALDN